MSMKRSCFTLSLVVGILSISGLISLLESCKAGPAALASTNSALTVCKSGPPDCQYSIIQDAVDAAGYGDDIKVAAGTYADLNNHDGRTQVIYADRNIRIRGGYTTSFIDPPDPTSNPTIVDALGQGRGVFFGEGVAVAIEGLHITNGDAAGLGGSLYGYDAGGGLYANGSAVSVLDCVITENTAQYGGGMHLHDSVVVLAGNTISHNSATVQGAGVFVTEGSATFLDNLIAENSSVNTGGGIILAADAVFKSNTIVGNLASTGGGLSAHQNAVLLMDNTITGNVASSYGGGDSVLVAVITGC